MKRSLAALTLAAGLAFPLAFFPVAPALAMPPIMDRVPEGAWATVVVPNFDKLQKNLTSLGTLMGFPMAGGAEQLLLMVGIDKGLKKDGAVAVIILPPTAGPKGEPPPEMCALVLVPTTGYAELLNNFGVKPGAAGTVDTVTIEEEDIYVKDIGDGYAAISPVKWVIDGYTGKAGNLALHKTIAGKAGDALADSSDLSVVVNVPLVKPLIESNLKEMKDKVSDQPQMGEALASAEWTQQLLLNDTSGAVIAFNVDNLGAAIDLAANFKADSRMAKVASIAGKSSELMGKLPGGKYLFAGAFDFSSAEIRKVLTEFSTKAGKGTAAVGMNEDRWRELLASSTGRAINVGFSPAGLFGGLLASTTFYTATTEPAKVIAADKAYIDSLNTQKLAQTKYTDAAAEINGVKADLYEVKMSQAAQGGPPGAAQMMGMLFGPAGGPNGYVAATDGGVVSTLGKNQALIASALAAAKGENTLMQDKLVSQVGEKMPKGRIGEAYLGVRGIIDTIMPLAGGFLMNVDIPQQLPPIGMSLAPQDGSLRATIFVPAPVLKLGADIAKQTQADEEEAKPAKDAPKEGTGQPKF